MMLIGLFRHRCLTWFLLGLALLSATSTTCLLADEPAQAADSSSAGTVSSVPGSNASAPAMGELRIEGEGVDQVTISRYEEGAAYRPIVLRQSDTSISLPVGKYRLRQIDLKGGYRYDPSRSTVVGQNLREWERVNVLTVRADQPCLLKIGPLNNDVIVSRHGHMLQLGYRLADAEGARAYSRQTQGEPPRFTVYCNGRAIGSGSFKYG